MLGLRCSPKVLKYHASFVNALFSFPPCAMLLCDYEMHRNGDITWNNALQILENEYLSSKHCLRGEEGLSTLKMTKKQKI